MSFCLTTFPPKNQLYTTEFYERGTLGKETGGWHILYILPRGNRKCWIDYLNSEPSFNSLFKTQIYGIVKLTRFTFLTIHSEQVVLQKLSTRAEIHQALSHSTYHPAGCNYPVLSCALLLIFSRLKCLISVTQSPKYTQLKRIDWKPVLICVHCCQIPINGSLYNSLSISC